MNSESHNDYTSIKIEKNVVTYISGFICQKLKSHICNKCNSLTGKRVHDIPVRSDKKKIMSQGL